MTEVEVCGGEEGWRRAQVPRYGYAACPTPAPAELKHSKSDDLILQSAPAGPADLTRGVSEASLQIQREACVLFSEDLHPGPGYHSDGETGRPPLRVTGDFPGSEPPSRPTSHYLHDPLNPEDTLRDIISENDFYRFVLFKRHYAKYLDISNKYEEARNIAYYLEEKYHEMKGERDRLAASHHRLEALLERTEAQVHDKEDELFVQLERAVRLEEDCDRVRSEKEKVIELKDRLEKEKNELYRKLKLQAEESEANRRRLERARNDVVRQVTEISAEKDLLERENIRLRDALEDVERRTLSRDNKRRIEKELVELKLVAKQSATLNSQLKKGMKHLASCRRRKCSVCAYTRATFGELHPSSTPQKNKGAKLFSCLQGELGDGQMAMTSADSRLALQLSHRLSALSVDSSCQVGEERLALAYIDECSGVQVGSGDCGSDGDEEEENEEDEEELGEEVGRSGYVSLTSQPHGLSSDSGFSSGDPSLTPSKSLRRTSAWTSSFRRLISRVSKRNNT